MAGASIILAAACSSDGDEVSQESEPSSAELSVAASIVVGFGADNDPKNDTCRLRDETRFAGEQMVITDASGARVRVAEIPTQGRLDNGPIGDCFFTQQVVLDGTSPTYTLSVGSGAGRTENTEDIRSSGKLQYFLPGTLAGP